MHSSCLQCTCRSERPFCALAGDSIRAIDQSKEQLALDKGESLFTEGRPARGIYLLCDGRAKLSVSSESGKRMTLRIAVPGEILGLEATLRGENYDFSAELMDSARVAYVKRNDLLKFLRENPIVCMEVVSRLSHHLHGAYQRVRSIGLSRTRRVSRARTRTAAV
jgi:CRP/FNR family transcriptional regulator